MISSTYSTTIIINFISNDFNTVQGILPLQWNNAVVLPSDIYPFGLPAMGLYSVDMNPFRTFNGGSPESREPGTR